MQEAERIADRLVLNHIPVRDSWLKMAELEFSVLGRSCLRQRIRDESTLRRHALAFERESNAARTTYDWCPATNEARAKLHRRCTSED